MTIQSQSQNKKKVLLTGGNGDLAKAIYNSLCSNYEVYLPLRDELDVSSKQSVELYFEDKQFDIVINLAGTLYSSRILDSDPELWIRDINVNLIGTYLVSRAALLTNKSTHIINISSTAGFNSYADWTSYCASKAGVLRLSEGLVKDGFKVNTLCPGAIETKIRDGLNIANNNVMSIEEGIEPILNCINEEFSVGSIVFYRKNELKILDNIDHYYQ
ncbi:SDR family oxidoreductase [Pseudoalteromonas luteoviolacea]|uniref:Uncharacterized protein n=1 Tax=Pseudoalteromonas luteoviolacea DSM 6061 TaxID=1365250 RepID=A0A166WGM3_9GAMM|nr:SDR family oxidoreductase [Pseudoalteromonas luteoviolacea]KZN37370.1 hypothetical protein N475_16900 [Pseudoalteromonas luteoviolacea DSM 6061]KZN59377.1 hypothetical protein N474_06695 [Pseudoalteromonas luteoviolacea CPMOR-2]MBE0387400.1 hypothetical protein [Pseudoalteromonas luteoviolacea DSM 6061]TQF72214.1 SDR family oxidoreductase [Pseudoalteromonas luteoviolacea]